MATLIYGEADGTLPPNGITTKMALGEEDLLV